MILDVAILSRFDSGHAAAMTSIFLVFMQNVFIDSNFPCGFVAVFGVLGYSQSCWSCMKASTVCVSHGQPVAAPWEPVARIVKAVGGIGDRVPEELYSAGTLTQQRFRYASMACEAIGESWGDVPYAQSGYALQSMWVAYFGDHVDGHEAIPTRILEQSKWRIIITSP